jgi:hypothetical protein
MKHSHNYLCSGPVSGETEPEPVTNVGPPLHSECHINI